MCNWRAWGAWFAHIGSLVNKSRKWKIWTGCQEHYSRSFYGMTTFIALSRLRLEYDFCPLWFFRFTWIRTNTATSYIHPVPVLLSSLNPVLFRLFLLGALFIHFMFLAALHFPVISITDLPPPFYCRMNLPSTNLHFTTCYFCFRCVIHIKTSSIPALHTLPPYDSTSPRILRIFGAATTFAW